MTYVSLLLSVAAIVVAMFVWLDSAARAERALAQREKALVHRYKPAIMKFYEDLDVEMPSKDPETTEELLDPMVKLLEPFEPKKE
jgi:hypothetical protein